MAKPKREDLRLADAHYDCNGCGACCRRVFVYVTPEDKQKLEALEFPPEAEIPDELYQDIGGNDYLAHQDRYCIFQERDTHHCKIHKYHGYDAKPLGCRVYPFNIVRTWGDEFSVLPRFDCPAIRNREGRHFREYAEEIRDYIEEMDLQGGGFSELDMDGLTRETIGKLIMAVEQYILGPPGWPVYQRLMTLNMAAHRWETLGPDFLNEMDLSEIHPSYFKRINQDLTERLGRMRRTAPAERWRFLAMLSGFLRRDEDLVGRAFNARLRRAYAIYQLLFRRMKLSDLGPEHPQTPLESKLIFTRNIANVTDDLWRPYLDTIRLRLATYQFFGPTNFQFGFFDGLKSLSFTLPLVLAAAKWSALAREPEECRLTAADVDYAVGAIEHSFGRCALLNLPVSRSFQRQCWSMDSYLAIGNTIVNGPPRRAKDELREAEMAEALAKVEAPAEADSGRETAG